MSWNQHGGGGHHNRGTQHGWQQGGYHHGNSQHGHGMQGHHGVGHHGVGHHGGSHHQPKQYAGYQHTGQTAVATAGVAYNQTPIQTTTYGQTASAPPPPGQYSTPTYQNNPGPVMNNQVVPPGIDPELWGWFQAVDHNNSGSITSNELQQALVNNNWSNFNAETCRLMIGMFDQDGSGTINIHEFASLWKYVQDWKSCFDRFDTDRSGTINQEELNQAFISFGYCLSPQFCNLCVRTFDRTSINTMKFDDFIQCCVMLKSLTDSFRRFDTNQNGVINISYEQFMDMVINNALS